MSGAADYTLADYLLQVRIPDISTADEVRIPVPYDGEIMEIQTVIEGAISGADADITAQINDVAVTDSLITVAQSGSAAGDVDSSQPTAFRSVVKGDNISIITDGASTGTVPCEVVIRIRR